MKKYANLRICWTAKNPDHTVLVRIVFYIIFGILVLVQICSFQNVGSIFRFYSHLYFSYLAYTPEKIFAHIAMIKISILS